MNSQIQSGPVHTSPSEDSPEIKVLLLKTEFPSITLCSPSFFSPRNINVTASDVIRSVSVKQWHHTVTSHSPLPVFGQMSSHSSSTSSPLREGPEGVGLEGDCGRSFVSRWDNPPIRVTAHNSSSGVTKKRKRHQHICYLNTSDRQRKHRHNRDTWTSWIFR